MKLEILIGKPKTKKGNQKLKKIKKNKLMRERNVIWLFTQQNEIKMRIFDSNIFPTCKMKTRKQPTNFLLENSKCSECERIVYNII